MFCEGAASNNNLLFGVGLGLMTKRVADEATNESGPAVGLPPLPSLLKEGAVVFSGDANPRGRTLALDLGEARSVG